MDKRNNDFDFDFTSIGQAIKKAREKTGMTREQLARIVDYDPRHLQAVENEGQYPSIELFIQLNRIGRHTTTRSRHTIPHAPQIRTSSNRADRPRCQAASEQSPRLPDCRCL